MSDWFTVFFCVKCHRSLTVWQRMYNDGTCPHCGNTNNSTIVDSYRRSARKLPRKRWWNPWEESRYEFKGLNSIEEAAARNAQD